MKASVLTAISAAVSLVVAACGPGGTVTSTSTPASGPITYDVQFENKTAAFNFQADAYYRTR